ncbi:uncharacterized protein LOC117113855 [Anneissia japonica]|uniref:uncharacterized protein LOC117113855 n=1 Tax=Anneissia japonica TaxID=1529436 RepID=UPI00142559E6|nr:uncharacterized protein LOC117113855 [Anneissia japonica]
MSLYPKHLFVSLEAAAYRVLRRRPDIIKISNLNTKLHVKFDCIYEGTIWNLVKNVGWILLMIKQSATFKLGKGKGSRAPLPPIRNDGNIDVMLSAVFKCSFFIAFNIVCFRPILLTFKPHFKETTNNILTFLALLKYLSILFLIGPANLDF